MNRAFSRPTRRAVLWRLCEASALPLVAVSRVFDWSPDVDPDERVRVYRAAARAGIELPPLAVARPMLPSAAGDERPRRDRKGRGSVARHRAQLAERAAARLAAQPAKEGAA